ncbi:MAG TPA: hypothetical protein VFK60_05945 [Casimicrobiaceae bacterium]|nr:hypothetical protein [Casimicrobiaceae bacterium]
MYEGEYAPLQPVRIVLRLVVRGIIPGGWSRIREFARSLPWLAPKKLPLAIVDWIAGLARHLDRLLRVQGTSLTLQVDSSRFNLVVAPIR